MTDPFDPLDELASAHLDGQTTDEEARRVEADPELQARVEALRALRGQLRSTPAPIDPQHRDARIAAALAAADEPDLADVTSFPRSRRHPVRLRIVGAVAAVALIAALVPALVRLGDDDPTTTEQVALDAESDDAAGGAQRSTEADDRAATTDGDGSDSPPSTNAAPNEELSAPATFALAPPVDLGPQADTTTLADAARAALAPPAGGDGPVYAIADEATSACLRQAESSAAADQLLVVLHAVAVLEDRPVVVTVREGADGTRSLTVVDPAADCAPILVDAPL